MGPRPAFVGPDDPTILDFPESIIENNSNILSARFTAPLNIRENRIADGAAASLSMRSLRSYANTLSAEVLPPASFSAWKTLAT